MTETPDEELVRRALAQARHTEPMPAEVLARMQETLTGLGAEPVATVTELRARRRRRTAMTGLVAAAAVVVAGVGIGSQWGSLSGGDGLTTAAEAPAAERDVAEEADDGATEPASPQYYQAAWVITEESFAEDAARLRGQIVNLSSGQALGLGGSPFDEGYADQPEADEDHTAIPGSDAGQRTLREGRMSADALKACADQMRAAARGDSVPVSWYGTPGWLWYLPPTDGGQVVNLIVCGEPEPVLSTVLPAP
ncbi:hypothetical protein [Nocardioides limicola]|uniref:hypothetical protein n=1 Tax=Nocardioides limicola TaxID=2803368 RepID=UPI00193BA490|nr:hypothetical protein [Nocardioides sp. DJM-14]